MGSKQQTRKTSTGANPAMHRAACARANSGAAGRHDSRPRRQRTRATIKRAAVRRDIVG